MYLHKMYLAAATYIEVGQNKTCCRLAYSGAISHSRGSNESLKISKHNRYRTVCSWWHRIDCKRVLCVGGACLAVCCNNTGTVKKIK